MCQDPSVAIDLESQDIPLFALVLGDDWQRLHPTVRRHYEIRAGQELTLFGEMAEIQHSTWAKPLLLLARMFGALVPFRGKGVSTTVRNACETDPHQLHFRRVFHFPGRRPVLFNSRMERLGGSRIVECVGFGIGIRMDVSVEAGALCFRTSGYRWRTGIMDIVLPDWLFLGSGRIVERGIDDRYVDLRFEMTHPIFGPSFRYSGRFRLPEPV